MSERELRHLLRVLQQRPEEDAVWVELARTAARSGSSPRLPEGARPRLVALLRATPGERPLARLWAELTGFEIIRPEAASFWRQASRLAGQGGDLHDRVTGLPLALRQRTSGLDLVLVAGGKVLFSEGNPGLAAIGSVDVEPFYMGRTQVTVDQYAEFVQATGSEPPTEWEAQLERPERPVVFVDRREAETFCRWVGARLPLEREWDRAASGGDGRSFPWGDAGVDTRANLPSVTRSPTAWYRYLEEIDRRPQDRSPFGVEGMAGNVHEWCLQEPSSQVADHRELDPLPGEDLDDAPAVCRGGSWRVALPPVGVAWRPCVSRDRRRGDLGLRVVCPLGDEPG